jgi:glycosyltransferase involved in cell wall biosynthesis
MTRLSSAEREDRDTWVGTAGPQESLGNRPRAVTIIIPMRNEERFVDVCLASVLEQLEDLPRCEVLCVDGASTDRTRQTVQEYAARDSRVSLVSNPSQIVPTGMNAAIRRARGDVIIRLDCHARYAPDYLQKCIEVLARTGADNVGGYVRTLPAKESRIGRAIATATCSRFGVGGATFRMGGDEQEVDTVPFGCFRRDVFEHYGMYDERLVRNQDIELNSRIRKGGGRIIISPLIRSTYYTRSTFEGLRQQAFNNGLWNPYTLYLVGGGLRLRHFVPLGFVGSLLVFALGGLVFRPLWLLLGLESLAYVVAAAVVAVSASRKAETSAWLVLAAFMQLHIAYGIGSLWGALTAPIKFGWQRATRPGMAIADRVD